MEDNSVVLLDVDPQIMNLNTFVQVIFPSSYSYFSFK